MLRRKDNANNSIRRLTPLVRRTPLKRVTYLQPKRKRKVADPELKAFYNDALENSTPVCEECGEDVYTSSAVAHLLPKKTFKSVRAHPSNKKCLGDSCGCHNKYDKNWASAVKMKIWPEAEVIILTVLIPLLPESEYAKLPDFLKEKYIGMFHDQQ